MKVNNVNTQYEVPGFDIAPKAFESEESEDFENAPYARDPGISSPPPAGGWQQLFGLMQTSPTPTSIDPPNREMTGRRRPGATASYGVVSDASRQNESQSMQPSQKVDRMMALLMGRQQAIAKIRQRASEVNQ